MKNPLLVPELREMLAAGAVDDLREFCDETPAPVAAEFIGALTSEEQKAILWELDVPRRAQIYAELDPDLKLALLAHLEEGEVVELLARLPDEARQRFLETVPEAPLAKLRELLERAPRELTEPVLAALREVQQAGKAPPEALSAEEIAAELKPLLQVYRFAAGRVERSERIEKGCWVHIVAPPRDSLPLIASRFRIPLDFLTAALDVDETARIEVEDAATLIITRVSYFDEKNVDILYFTLPVGVILTNGMILTVCSRRGTVLEDFIDHRVRHSAGGHRFILQFLYRATLLYLSHLKQLNNAADIIQKRLEQETRNRQLLKLFHIERSLVYFTTSLRSNQLLFERLGRLKVIELDEPNESLLEDILTESKQAIEMANIYSDILSGMMDAFASVISNNLNAVMKVLTSVTILMTIPVLVTSIFGMNVKLPLEDHPLAFVFVLGISLALGAGVLLVFWKKRWLEL